jgi:hypothetical protein
MLDLILLTSVPRGLPSRIYRGVEDLVRGRRRSYISQVSRSLIAGLSKQSDVSWAYIPNYAGERAKTIYVVNNARCAEVVGSAKTKGLCERFYAGSDSLSLGDEVDAAIVPSEWWGAFRQRSHPSFVGRTMAWAAGVDSDFWQPSPATRSKVLIYHKKRGAYADVVAEHLVKSGYDILMLQYGSYTLDDYRRALNEAFANVVVAGSESQGVALYESWAMDVPTLVARCDFDPEFGPCSAAPYLTDQTGAFWDHESELPGLLAAASTYRPRDWIMANGTDEISARELIKIALP